VEGLLADAFEPGWKNAWLMVLGLWLPAFISAFVNINALKRLVDTSWYTPDVKLWMAGCMSFFGIYTLYSIGVPLQPDTILFMPGLVLYSVGYVGLIMTYIVCSKTPIDHPFEPGPYRISRNPLYLFTGLGLFGVALASSSWLLFLFLTPLHLLQHKVVLAEERYCAKRYGDAYSKYSERVPRYFLFF